MKPKKVEIPKTITSEVFKKKYAARANVPKTRKKKELPQELREQTILMKWFKATYPKALYQVDLAGSAKMGLNQIILHSQRAKRGHPDLMFYEWFKAVFCGLAIEYKALGTDIAKQCEKDDHFKEQLEFIYSLRERGWCAVFVAGVEPAKRVISAYMEASDKSIEIINKHGYPKI